MHGQSQKKIRILTDLTADDVRHKVVLVRVDYNVRDKDGKTVSKTRLAKSVRTIQWLVEHDARIVLLSHCGRPFEEIKRRLEEMSETDKVTEDDKAAVRKKVFGNLSLDAVTSELRSVLAGGGIDTPVFARVCTGEEVRNAVDDLDPGRILLLENVRSVESVEAPGKSRDQQEEQGFAEEIVAAVKPSAHVIDGFSVCHRNHASVTGIAHAMRRPEETGSTDLKGGSRPIVAGCLLDDEIREVVIGLHADNVEHPYIAVLGGAKVSGKGGKLKAIQGLLGVADAILIGGAMLYPFLRAKGLDVGQEPRGKDPECTEVQQDIEEAKKLLGGPENEKIYLPTVLAGLVDNVLAEPVDVTRSCPEGFRMQDVDPDSLSSLLQSLDTPATIVWNGPMGRFEDPRFRGGTKALLEYMDEARRNHDTRTVAGGGDTEPAIRDCHPQAKLTHISTGGGAMLAALAGQPLPGIEVLDLA